MHNDAIPIMALKISTLNKQPLERPRTRWKELTNKDKNKIEQRNNGHMLECLWANTE
jgi:hypothetical protein